MFDNGLLQYGSSDPVVGSTRGLGHWAGADANWLEKLRTEWAAAAIFATAASAPAPSEAPDIWGSALPPAPASERDDAGFGGIDAEVWLAAFSGDSASGDWHFG